VTTPSEPLRITADAYPALYVVADSGSVAGQRLYRRLVAVELALVLAGAGFATLGTFVPALQRICLWLAAASLIGAIAMKLINRQGGSYQRWFDGRAVAETVKTQTWRYMMRVPPYGTDANADESFAADVISAMRARPDLVQPLDRLPDDPRQISSTMRAVRALPLDARLQVYLAERLADQAKWYKARAIANLAQGRRWFWLSLLAQVAAVLFAFLSLLWPDDAVATLIALGAAVATAATAWGQLGRHDELSKSYALAYQELITIQALAGTAVTEDGLDRLVTSGESAISREHTMWMAKRADPTGPIGG
jgi:hypothetical protein